MAASGHPKCCRASRAFWSVISNLDSNILSRVPTEENHTVSWLIRKINSFVEYIG